jgi:hypothetical protein
MLQYTETAAVVNDYSRIIVVASQALVRKVGKHRQLEATSPMEFGDRT